MINNLWLMGIQGSGLILLILAARWVLAGKPYPRSWCYSLWMLVGFRLLCPIFIESNAGIQPDLRKFWVQEQTEAEIDGLQDSWVGPEMAGLPELGPSAFADEDESESFGATSGASRADSLFFDRSTGDFRWMEFLRVIYGLGVCVTAAVFFLQYERLKKRVATAVREPADVGRRTEVRLCENISSPFVMGFFRYRIYLPYGLSGEEKDWILRHEQMHIRHGDPLIRLIGLLAVCLHWWNPLVWYGFREMCKDMEMTCDESVLKHAGLEERKIYAGALLHTAMHQSGLLAALPFGESHTEQRVRNLLIPKRESFPAYFLFMLFVGICAHFFVMVSRTELPPENASGMWEDGDLSDMSGNAPEGMRLPDMSGNAPEEIQLPDMSGYSTEEMPVALTDLILGDWSVVSAGASFELQLILTEGEYFTEEYAGAGGGTFEENYRGSYELRVLDERGREASSLRLRDEFGEEQFNFGGAFDLAVSDYNQDGCADFTLGTWGSSSMGIYYLYTIDGDGRVSMAYPEGIVTMGFAFSGKLESMDDPGFFSCSYNNATGQYSRVPYVWDEARMEYVKGEEMILPEGEEIPVA